MKFVYPVIDFDRRITIKFCWFPYLFFGKLYWLQWITYGEVYDKNSTYNENEPVWRIEWLKEGRVKQTKDSKLFWMGDQYK